MSSSDSNEEGVRVSFVGCGTIASAIATGLATQSNVTIGSISVSRRSRAKSQALEGRFPSLVTVYDDNQEVVDRSDIVFVCVLPQATSQILQDLTFEPSRHRLVSLVATVSIDDLVKDSKLDSKQVSKMICLPAVAQHAGVCLHCTKNETSDPTLDALFESLGGLVTTHTEQQMSASMISTCLMGPLYGIMRQNREWLVKNAGLSKLDASNLITKQYMAVIHDAVHRNNSSTDPDLLDELIEEQTPGGINEQSLANIQQMGVLDAYDKASDAIFARIEGRSDGSVPKEDS